MTPLFVGWYLSGFWDGAISFSPMSPLPARCRSNAVSGQRPSISSCQSLIPSHILPIDILSSARTLPKLSLLIPPTPCSPRRPIASTSSSIDERAPSSESHLIPTTPVPHPLLPPTPPSTQHQKRPHSPDAHPSKASNPPSPRTARAKLVAGLILARHSPRGSPCPWGALRSACGARRYVRTPLRVEVC